MAQEAVRFWDTFPTGRALTIMGLTSPEATKVGEGTWPETHVYDPRLLQP